MLSENRALTESEMKARYETEPYSEALSVYTCFLIAVTVGGHYKMSKLTPFLLAICAMLSCQEPLEEQVVGHWIDTNHKSYIHTKIGPWDKFVLDTVEIIFLDGGKWVVNSDTSDLVFKDNGYVYDAENYKSRQPSDEWYTFRVLDISDTSLKLEQFWFRDTVNLKRKEITHPNNR